MFSSKKLWMLAGLVGTLFVAGCGSDDDSTTQGTPGTGGTAGSAGSDAGGTGGTAGSSGSGGSTATTFDIVIENISGTTAMPTPFAPGVVVVHGSDDPIFSSAAADRGEGLSPLAEDGAPSALATSLGSKTDISQVVPFNDAIEPGKSQSFSVTGKAGDKLSLATMLAQTNDLFLSPDGKGIDLFDSSGAPVSGDVSKLFGLWDVGTERNEAPSQGPSQAPRQPNADYGPSEGVVSMRMDGTRALPLPQKLVNVVVTEASGTYTIKITNISGTGPFKTPIAPVIHALHNDTVKLFDPGAKASDGLQTLAEEGDPSTLVTEVSGAVVAVGVAGTSPFIAGDSVTFDVTPSASAPLLSFAGMLVQTNDAFLATMPAGVPLLDAQDAPRPADDVARDIMKMLAVWDAGTEVNEVPGVGSHQPPRAAGNSGAKDPNTSIRLYADSTNDLAKVTTVFPVKIVLKGNTTFLVTITNASGPTAFPAKLTPVAYAAHADTAKMFEIGKAASAGLQSLAEDGNPAVLVGALKGAAGVLSAGSAGNNPIGDGEEYTFEVTLNKDHRFLSIASMVVPSNDTFISLGSGVALLDASGAPRANADIATDVAGVLAAYESGTEANQAGALGPDMAPYQSGPNIGAAEGDGKVRPVNDVWAYPMPENLLRVTITSK